MESLESVAREYGFNPSQARGPDGKWITVGSFVKHATHGEGMVVEHHRFGKVGVRFNRGGLKKVSGKDLSPSDRKIEEMTETPIPVPSHAGSKVGNKTIKQVGRRGEHQREDMSTGAQTLAEAAAQAKRVRSARGNRLAQLQQLRDKGKGL